MTFELTALQFDVQNDRITGFVAIEYTVVYSIIYTLASELGKEGERAVCLGLPSEVCLLFSFRNMLII